MKILFFSPYYYPYISGVTTYPQKILSYLAKQNYIQVLTFRYDKKLKANEIFCKYKITRMNYWFRISKGFISLQSIFYFLNKIRNSDLVFLNQPNFEGLLLAIVAKVSGKKIISIFHCQVFLEGNLLTKIINHVLNVSMKIQLNLSDKIVVFTKDYLNSLPYSKKLSNKILEISPPIEKSVVDKKFFNKLLKLKKNSKWVGYAGRISLEKGLEYLVEAMKQLNNEIITLVFAGPYGHEVAGENIYYDKIINLLKKYKLKHLFLGNLTAKQLGAFYKSIDLLVLPSINQTEAFGMVQAEAMINGTPVVASNLPGVRMPIELTKMGIITEPKNITQLTQGIRNILNNRNKYSNKILIKNAQNTFDIKKVYKSYEKLLTTIN